MGGIALEGRRWEGNPLEEQAIRTSRTLNPFMPLPQGGWIEGRISSPVLPRREAHNFPNIDRTQRSHRNIFIEGDRGHAEFRDMQ